MSKNKNGSGQIAPSDMSFDDFEDKVKPSTLKVPSRPVDIYNNKGKQVGRVTIHNVRGDYYFGEMVIHTLACPSVPKKGKKAEETPFVAFDENDNNAQRGHKETRVFNGIINNCYIPYLNDYDTGHIPKGLVVLALRPGETIETCTSLLVMDGGHRLRAAAKTAQRMMKHFIFPVQVMIAANHTAEELAKLFVACNMATPVNQKEMLNAGVISGELKPVADMFRLAQEQGVIGDYKIVFSPEAYRSHIKDGKVILFGEVLPHLLAVMFTASTKSEYFDFGNDITQECVNNYLRVYYMFCRTIGRRGIDRQANGEILCPLRTKQWNTQQGQYEMGKNPTAIYSNTTFQYALARLALAMPIKDELAGKDPEYCNHLVKGVKKPTTVCCGASEEHWQNFLNSLLSPKGRSQELKKSLDESGTGSKAVDLFWRTIENLGVCLDDANYRSSVIPELNYPSDVYPEYLVGGVQSKWWIRRQKSKPTRKNPYSKGSTLKGSTLTV